MNQPVETRSGARPDGHLAGRFADWRVLAVGGVICCFAMGAGLSSLATEVKSAPLTAAAVPPERILAVAGSAGGDGGEAFRPPVIDAVVPAIGGAMGRVEAHVSAIAPLRAVLTAPAEKADDDDGPDGIAVPKPSAAIRMKQPGPVAVPAPSEDARAAALENPNRAGRDLDQAPYWHAHDDPAGSEPFVTARTDVPSSRELRAAVQGRKRIAIVIDDLGLNNARTQATIGLPGRHTLAFLPYGRNVRTLAQQAANAGHELIVHMPMEPVGRENPGPRAVRRGLADAEIEARVDWALSQFDGFVGFNNHMGSRATSDPKTMSVVMARVRGRGLYFLDSLTSGRSVAMAKAREAGLPSLVRDVFIDHEQTRSFVQRQLRQVEILARQRGHAIAIGHPHHVTIDALEGWIPAMQAKGFEFVAVSTLLDDKARKERERYASNYTGD